MHQKDIHRWIRFVALMAIVMSSGYTIAMLSENNKKLNKSLHECRATMDLVSKEAIECWKEEQERLKRR